MTRAAYPTDLCGAEFACLAPLLPPPKPRGRPREHPVREVLDALFDLVRSGCQWRLLPQGFPPGQPVDPWFRRWRLDGTWERVHAVLRERVRVAGGRDPPPSAGILDRPSGKPTGGGGGRGCDGAKQVSGRKRHLLVETQGLVLRAVVPTAALQARAAVPRVLSGVRAADPRLRHGWLDQGSTGSGRAWTERELGRSGEIVAHPRKPRGIWWPVGEPLPPAVWAAARPTGFRGVLPRRWVVERTFSWLGQSRRLSKDYEHRCATSEALIDLPMSRIMLKRLARA